MKPITSVLIILALVPSFFVLAEELYSSEEYSSEEIAVLEEEMAEEIVIEEKAGTTPDSTLYVVDDVVEDVVLLIKSGEDKADYASKVKEEKIAEASLMIAENKTQEAQESLTKANNVSEIVADEVGLKLGEKILEETKLSQELLEQLKEKLPTEAEWKAVNNLVESQLNQEEKIRLATTLAQKIGNYCDELAKLDYQMMEEDEHCNPSQAPDWLKNYVEEDLKARQKGAEEMMVGMITTCINDPRECDCNQIPIKSEQRDCEKNTQLAIKCEFEMDLSACEKLSEIPVTVPEGIPDFLVPIFEKTITEAVAKKEKEMFAKFAPPECLQAGLNTKEDCEQLMIEKYTPPECKEAGALTREECDALMMEKYGAPPEECLKDGKPLSREECEAIMIKKHNIPEECTKDGHPISEEECREIMLPPECKEAGAYTQEKCEKVMIEKYVPPECKEAGAYTQEECEKVMKEKGGEIGGPLPECQEGAEGYLGPEECAKRGKGEQPGPEEKSLVEEKWKGYEIMPVREDLVVIKNPETGVSETVTKEEAKRWVEENLGQELVGEIIPGEEIESLKEEIENLEEAKEKGVPKREEELPALEVPETEEEIGGKEEHGQESGSQSIKEPTTGPEIKEEKEEEISVEKEPEETTVGGEEPETAGESPS